MQVDFIILKIYFSFKIYVKMHMLLKKYIFICTAFKYNNTSLKNYPEIFNNVSYIYVFKFKLSAKITEWNMTFLLLRRL